MRKTKYIRHLFLIALASIFTYCKDGKTDANNTMEPTLHDTEAIDDIKKSENHTTNDTTTIQRLKEAFENKNEAQFLAQFPSNFQQFMQYFGWNTETDQPSELYEDSYAYNDYFFELLSQDAYRKFEKKLVGIGRNGAWQEDGVNYFQDLTLKYINNKERYELIDQLSSNDAKSVLFFLFDGPHPKLNTNFSARLSPSKKAILEELFETGFYDHNENPDPIVPYPGSLEPMDYDGSIAYELSDFEDNEHYFIRDIDLDNDGLIDKIVSADRYQGDELLLFLHKGDEFQFALKTTNFSADGGNQIVDIMKEDGGFVIETAFPDGGFSEAHHHITFKDNAWVLNNTVYKTQSSHLEDAFIYVCDVQQGLGLADVNFSEKLKWLPEETDREHICAKERIK